MNNFFSLQKLTHSSQDHRSDAITEYSNNDILGLSGNISLGIYEENILRYILKPMNSDHKKSFLQQTTARFLNSLASLACGRNYLTTDPKVLNSVCNFLLLF